LSLFARLPVSPKNTDHSLFNRLKSEGTRVNPKFHRCSIPIPKQILRRLSNLIQGGIVKKFRLPQGAMSLVYWIRVILFTVTIMLLSSFILAGEQPTPDDENQIEKQIEIIADQFTSSNEGKYMDFTGDVRASQGNFVITSEQLRIYYKANPDSTKNQTDNQELIKQIVASGNVKISSEKYTAAADLVEYDLDSTVLVLKGENSTIKSGKNLITGSIITVNRKDGQIKVERGAQKRVKALFYSKEKNLNDQQKTE
jgi:lipopolysaccharide transport protein LptA